MKNVILKSLSLTNWRGEKKRTTNFNPVETSIFGENGLGKSRHFDAFMWLLFGKDSQDRKDFNIKSVVDGKPLIKTACEVVGILDVNGEQITLRRSFVEDWVKPRGQVEQVYKGNHTETFWNETPVNVSEYQKRINEIIDESVFKMVTNPYFFVNMNWKNQREQLFQIAGTITDSEIANGNPDFVKLLDSISGKSFSDFKKELAARKKKLKDELDEIQPRIDQTQKLMPETADFATIESEIVKIDAEIAKIDAEIADQTKAIRASYEAEQDKMRQINDMKTKQQSAYNDAMSKLREDAFNANAKRHELELNIKGLHQDLSRCNREISNYESELQKLKSGIESKTKETDSLRKAWYDENAKEYVPGDNQTICPLYNFCCDNPKVAANREEANEAARQSFNKTKEERLSDITQNGKDLGTLIEKMNKDIADVEKSLENARIEAARLTKEIENVNNELNNNPIVAVQSISNDSIPMWNQLQNQIDAIEATIEKYGDKIDTTDLQTRKKEMVERRDSQKALLANRTRIEQCNNTIKELEEKGKSIAQSIADAEQEEYIAAQFTKKRVEECEKRINGLFTMVQFQLFDYTIEGNEVETCVPLVNGVPFPVANTAGQVNAGLDIINALTGFYGVNAPIFIDGRESVNNIIQTNSQIINLVVSHDKELIIK